MTGALAYQLSNLIKDPRTLARELQQSNSKNLRRRRGIIAFSLIGMAAMTAVTLLQNGIIHHLPDPSVGNFDSDKVNSSKTAYRWNVPDGAISLASLALNVPLAAFGGEDRVKQFPLLPISFSLKSVGEALAASWYFYQMPVKEKAWCPYCVVGAIANIAIAALSISETREAVRVLRVR